jgi:CMP-2-keto-3-deoxyoctulosonic acid synthetase
MTHNELIEVFGAKKLNLVAFDERRVYFKCKSQNLNVVFSNQDVKKYDDRFRKGLKDMPVPETVAQIRTDGNMEIIFEKTGDAK